MTAFSKEKQKAATHNKYIFWWLIAIELFMSFSFFGYVHIEPISITFAYIPVLIAGAVLGPAEATVTGAIFGLASMWKASAFYVGAGDAVFSPVTGGQPVESILLSIGSRALFGFLAGILYMLARKSRYPKAGIVVVSGIGRLLHTFCVYLFMGILFPEMGYTAADTLKSADSLDYLVSVLIIDSIVLFCYVFSRSGFMEQLMRRVYSVDELKAAEVPHKGRLAVMAVLVIISSFSVAVYFTNRIGSVMRNYGISLPGKLSYDLMHLQIQFLMGMISLAAMAIIVIILVQKNSIYSYYEARLDGLTGLYSRQQFFQTGEILLHDMMSGSDGAGGYFVILDVDDFKGINDCYGHPVGDKVLKEVAENLKRIFYDQGIIGRLGGDEFVALIFHPASKEEIREKLDRMKKSLSEIQIGERSVSCSIGVIPVEEGYTIDELYRNADRLLYEAKKNGKNRFAFGYRFH